MLSALKQQVLEANLRLVREGLVIATFGNVSGIDRKTGIMVIKPSGVAYEQMRADDMVAVALETGKIAEGSLRPSSDTPTHLELYRAFPALGGIAHTHSRAATAWAQASRGIPCFGTTHADYFRGEIPCTRAMRTAEITEAYELNAGKVIVERFKEIAPMEIPAVLVAGHGPFAWGESPDKAVETAKMLEYAAVLAADTLRINPASEPIPADLRDRHFSRKHGPQKYYGQRSC